MHDKLCTGDPKIVKEARLSFPSGHSSFSTYSMVFVIVNTFIFSFFFVNLNLFIKKIIFVVRYT